MAHRKSERVFADSVFWIALVNPHDPWAPSVEKALGAIEDRGIVTTEEILCEVFNALGAVRHLRELVIGLYADILGDDAIEVIEQTHESFVDGHELYVRRLDKKYSLTDCISMTHMRQQGIRQVLSNDKHFTQEGFEILMRD